MTNFRRALLALITFITGVGLSLGVGAGIASAHTPHQTVECSGWSVTMTDFEGPAGNNSIVITIDGVAQPAVSFGGNAEWPGNDNVSYATSGTWTQTANHTLSYAVDAQKINSSNKTTYDFTFSGSSVACKTLVNPLEPTVTHTTVCAVVDTYTIPTKAGIQYKVGGVNTAAGTYSLAAGVTVNITAVLSTPPNPANSVLGTPTSWSFTGGVVEVCPIPVTGIVTFTDPTCPNQNTASVTKTVVTGVVYTQTGTVAPGGTVNVTAAALNSTYTYTGTASWSHTFPSAADCTEHVTANVTFTDPTCANQNTAAVIGAVDTASIDFTVTGTVAPGGSVTVTAVAKAGYTLDGTASWSHTFTSAKDCTEHVTANVTFKDPTCADLSVAVIGAVDTSSIDFTITGTVAAGQSVTVTAVAKAGYTLDGTASWSHTFPNVPDCTTHVTANATFGDPTCASLTFTVTTTPVTGVTYITTGTPGPGATVTVSAAAQEGYTLDGTNTWSHTYPGTPDCRIVSEPVAPTVHRSELCEVKDQFQAGPTTGVVYSVTAGVLNQGQIVVIVATPAAGYKFAGEAQIVTYTVVGGTVQDCPVPPTTVSIAPDVPLPKTGGGTSGLTIGGIMLGTGILTLAALRVRRRKVNA